MIYIQYRVCDLSVWAALEFSVVFQGMEGLLWAQTKHTSLPRIRLMLFKISECLG